MNAIEIKRMGELEQEHWWYRGLRDAITRTLCSSRWQLPRGTKVLDAGCGTGANLALLRDTLRPGYLGGFDISPAAVEASRRKVPGADVYLGDLRDPQIHAPELDLVLSCDALSIAGMRPCHAGLKRLVASLRRGGLMILNLPAYRWLHSSHDHATETRDRVTAPEISRLLISLGLGVELLTYRLFWLLPAIVLSRLPSIFRGRRSQARSDLKPTSSWANRLLGGVLSAENRAMVRGISFPLGSSVYVVARKL